METTECTALRNAEVIAETAPTAKTLVYETVRSNAVTEGILSKLTVMVHADDAQFLDLLAKLIDERRQARFEAQTTRPANERANAVALAELLKVQRHNAAIAGMERQDFGVARMGGGIVSFGREDACRAR